MNPKVQILLSGFTVVALALSGCNQSSEASRIANSAGAYCLPDKRVAEMTRPPISVANARRLSLYFGLCRFDVANQEKWLRIAVDLGDRSAAAELASQLEGSGRGDTTEVARLRRFAAYHD